MSRANWSKEESDLLEKVYRIKTANEIAEIFPQYTNTQILRRAKILGLKKDPLVAKQSRLQNSIIARQDLWSEEEKKILVEYYPSVGGKGVQELLLEKLGKFREVDAIIGRANSLHLTRKSRDLVWKASGVEIKDTDGFSVVIEYKGY